MCRCCQVRTIPEYFHSTHLIQTYLLLKGFEPAASPVGNQDATTATARHGRDKILNRPMLQ